MDSYMATVLAIVAYNATGLPAGIFVRQGWRQAFYLAWQAIF